MIIELRKKSQITIPKQFVEKLGLKEGDKLNIVESNGSLKIIPVAVYPRKYIEQLREEVADIKYKIRSGEQAVFERVDDLFAHLDSEPE